jgi:hypothetical protein
VSASCNQRNVDYSYDLIPKRRADRGKRNPCVLLWLIGVDNEST